VVGWGIDEYVKLQTAGPNSSGYSIWLATTFCST